MEVVKFPMNSEEMHIQNKKCDYKTLAIMTLYSNMTPKEMLYEEGTDEIYRYVYKDKIIKFTDEIEKLSKNKINTIIKNMRKLSKLDNRLVNACKSKEGKIYYKINYTDMEGKSFVTIEEDILRVLINACNSNTIKIYILLKYMCRNGEVKMTREYIASQIGLSPSKGKQIVTDCTKILSGAGFINKRKEYVYGNEIKCDIYYSVNDYELWKKIYNKL